MAKEDFEQRLRRNYQGPFMATDIIIRYDDGRKNGIVLIERKYFPLGLALPGGIAEHIPLYENAVKEAKEETGLDVVIDNPEKPLCVLTEVNQDPRAFIGTAVFTAKGCGELKPMEEEDAKSAAIYTNREVAALLMNPNNWAFPKHHRRALTIYLEEIAKSGR